MYFESGSMGAPKHLGAPDMFSRWDQHDLQAGLMPYNGSGVLGIITYSQGFTCVYELGVKGAFAYRDTGVCV